MNNNNIGITPLNTSNLFSILNLINRTLPLQSNDILNRSFNDQGGSSHPTDEKVIKNLKQIEFEEDSELNCGICLESFKKCDKALLLPCKDNKHYFHLGEDKENCEGILPWLKENNTCPICRETFKEKDLPRNLTCTKSVNCSTVVVLSAAVCLIVLGSFCV